MKRIDGAALHKPKDGFCRNEARACVAGTISAIQTAELDARRLLARYGEWTLEASIRPLDRQPRFSCPIERVHQQFDRLSGDQFQMQLQRR